MAQGKGLEGFAWPENCGDFDMRIAQDGTWYYQNSPIGRKTLCQLFSTVLQKDAEGQYWLVTPVERGLIHVEDAPFTIVEMQIKTQGNTQGDGVELHFRTNLDHWFRLDNDHTLILRKSPIGDEMRPYIHVRDGLEGLIIRSVYYELVNIAKMEAGNLYLDSADQRFFLGSLEE